ncbi:MAG: DUF4340 domain-containing protein [Akkermansiaceae bacterium]
MTRIHLLILWVLSLVAGAILFSVKGSKHQATEESTMLAQGDSVLTADQLRTSSGLRVRKGDETSSLILNEKGWVVSEQKDFPANIETLSAAFDTLRKLKITQGLPAGPEAWERFGLDENAEKQADKPRILSVLAENGSDALTIYIGKQRESNTGAQGPGGRFIRLSSDDSTIYVVEESFDQISAASDAWINKQLPKVDAPLSVSVKRESGDSWTVSRKTAVGDMILEDLDEGNETIVAQTAPLKTIFSANSFTEILTEDEVHRRKAVGEGREVTIVTASGITYLFSLIPELKEEAEKKDDDDQTVKPDSRNYIVSMKMTSGPKPPEKPKEDATQAEKAGYHALVSNMKNIERQYAKDKKLEGRYFLVPNFVINALTKQKSELQQKVIAKPEATSPPVSSENQPAKPPLAPNFIPGGPNNPQPANGPQPRKRIEAVTPPIAIPQIPKKEEAKEEPKPKSGN